MHTTCIVTVEMNLIIIKNYSAWLKFEDRMDSFIPLEGKRQLLYVCAGVSHAPVLLHFITIRKQMLADEHLRYWFDCHSWQASKGDYFVDWNVSLHIILTYTIGRGSKCLISPLTGLSYTIQRVAMCMCECCECFVLHRAVIFSANTNRGYTHTWLINTCHRWY